MKLLKNLHHVKAVIKHIFIHHQQQLFPTINVQF
jgi:hypothetical protein